MPRIQLGQAGGALLPLTMLEELVVEQALNRHWTCTLTLHAAPESRPDAEELHGESLRIGALDAEGAETVLFEGFVRRVRLRYEIGGEYRVLLEAVSLSWRLDQGGRFSYHRQQTARAAAAATLGHCGLALAGSMPEGATLSYVQWEEPDFPFFARLVDDGEAWFRPATDGAAAVEVQTAFQPGTQLLWRDPEEGLFHWADQGHLRPLTTRGAHYDPQVGLSRALTGVSSPANFYGGAAARMVAAVQTGAGSLGDRQAGRPRSATLADHLRSTEHESRRALASAVTCEGRSQNPRVRAGDTLEVVGLPGVNGVYGVVEAQHRWTHKGYENRFLATPAKTWLPAERPLRPSLDGLYPARVTANHDPHNQGRIRVSYYWQEDGETTWMRLLAPHAGPGRGFLFLPEVGDEVLVCFEEGDPERPYVVGSAWNGVHQPPTSGFHTPGEPNGAEFSGNNIKRLVTKSGHRITMVDTPGKETVSIATPTQNKLVLTEYHADTGRPAIVLATAGDLILSAPNGRIHSHSATHSREVGAPAVIQVAAKEEHGTLWNLGHRLGLITTDEDRVQQARNFFTYNHVLIGGSYVDQTKMTDKEVVEAFHQVNEDYRKQGGGLLGAAAMGAPGEGLKYEANDGKHGSFARSGPKGEVSKEPTNGAEVLTSSVPLKGTSSARVGVDASTGEYVTFREHRPGLFHGYATKDFGGLDNEAQAALRKAGLVSKRGKILDLE